VVPGLEHDPTIWNRSAGGIFRHDQESAAARIGHTVEAFDAVMAKKTPAPVGLPLGGRPPRCRAHPMAGIAFRTAPCGPPRPNGNGTDPIWSDHALDAWSRCLMAFRTDERRGPEDDLVQPFLVVAPNVRGRLVRLGPSANEILSQHDYPAPVAVMLGELLALAGVLAGALKYDGVFTLQIKGDGPVSLLVVDVTSEGHLRGYAQFDGDRLGSAIDAVDGPIGDSVPRLLGSGHLAFTVDQGPDTERYQGIVPLEGELLSACVAHYFDQSEQIDASLRAAAGQVERGGGEVTWRSAAIMVQRLPQDQAKDHDLSAGDEPWRRTRLLMETVRPDELLDPELPPNDLLYRLFHEDGVRVYEPVELAARCRCSRERVVGVLGAIDVAQLEELKEDGVITVTCEFCGRVYRFDDEEITALQAD